MKCSVSRRSVMGDVVLLTEQVLLKEDVED
jgi:hypothetical protein